jgi:hypothetical protein
MGNPFYPQEVSVEALFCDREDVLEGYDYNPVREGK